MFTVGVDLASGEEDSLELFSVLPDFCSQSTHISLFVYIESLFQKGIEERYPHLPKNLTIYYCQSNITMEDVPSRALLQRKKDSSMVKSLNMLKYGKIQCLFSPGNTGSLIVLAKEIIGLRKKISFPAIAVFVPNKEGEALILDVGANLLIDEERGLELATMGVDLFKTVYPTTKPELAILNVGTEHYKGGLWIQKLNKILKKQFPSYYQGFKEGYDVFLGDSNILITSGYAGNILLKSIEGYSTYMAGMLRRNFDDKVLDDILLFFQKEFHYSRCGTGHILGLKKPIFIGHGNTDKVALYNALCYLIKDKGV